jgi:hypothetical protein
VISNKNNREQVINMIMKGNVHIAMEFDINDKIIYGYIKRYNDDAFVEIRDKETDVVHQCLYTGSLTNEGEMLSAVESLINKYYEND